MFSLIIVEVGTHSSLSHRISHVNRTKLHTHTRLKTREVFFFKQKIQWTRSKSICIRMLVASWPQRLEQPTGQKLPAYNVMAVCLVRREPNSHNRSPMYTHTCRHALAFALGHNVTIITDYFWYAAAAGRHRVL